MGEWGAIVYLGLFCNGLAIIVQSKAQQHTTPIHTGIILSIEPIFTAIFSAIFIWEVLALREVIGAIIVLLGVITTVVGFNNIWDYVKKEIEL